MTYRVRQIRTAAELAIVKELNTLSFGNEKLEWEGESVYWWLLWYKTQPVGYAGLRQSHQYSDVGYLYRTGIVSAHQGKGLQKKLIKARLQKAKRLGWKWVRTDTRDNLPSANNLIACGFKLFQPASPWAFRDSLYWVKMLQC